MCLYKLCYLLNYQLSFLSGKPQGSFFNKNAYDFSESNSVAIVAMETN